MYSANFTVAYSHAFAQKHILRKKKFSKILEATPKGHSPDTITKFNKVGPLLILCLGRGKETRKDDMNERDVDGTDMGHLQNSAPQM